MSSPPRPQCSFLQTCADRFEEGSQRLEQLAAELDQARATWKPGAGRWSAAECVEHLNVTTRLYDEALAPAITTAREQGRRGQAPYGRGTFVGRFLLSVLDPQRKLKKVKAPAVFRPEQSDLDWSQVCAAFRDGNRRLMELMLEADGLDLGRVIIASPISRLAKLTVAQAFDVLSIHELRHLAQAERVAEAEGFPAR